MNVVVAPVVLIILMVASTLDEPTLLANMTQAIVVNNGKYRHL